MRAGVLADLTAECAALDALVGRAAGRATGPAPTPADGLDDRPPRSRTWPGPTTSRRSRRPTPTSSAGCCSGLAARVAPFVDEAAAERATQPPDELLARWRAGRRALVDALDAVPDGTKLPWFGPPMSPASMAHRAADGDLGARAGRRRRARRPPRADRPAAARGAHRRAHPRLRLPDPRRDAARPSEFRVELVGPSGALWTWGPDDAAQQRDRAGARLLPARHPAPPPGRPRRRRDRAPTPTTGSTSRRPSPARPARAAGPAA